MVVLACELGESFEFLRLVDVSNLDCGGIIRVRDLEVKNCTFNVIPAYPLFGIKQVKADTNAKVV